MITTVTLNPCIDYTTVLPRFTQGALNLMTSSRTDVSGKGINVSVVLKELGQDSFATGISFVGNHNMIQTHLEKKGIRHEFAMEEGTIRTNVKIIETETGAHSEINSVGDIVGEQTLRELSKILERQASESRVLIFSGRIPNGAPASIYRSLLRHLRNFGCKVVLDTGGDALLQGIEQKPTLIKPNELEFEQLTEKKPTNLLETAKRSRVLLEEKGMEYLCVSLGGQGALLTDKDHSYFAPPLSVEVQGVTGAGDSMVAGMSYGLAHGFSTEEMLRYGVAAATATVLREGTLLCQKRDFDKLLPMVRIETVA